MTALPGIETATADVLVLGGGIAGLRAALAARRAGRDVLLLCTAHGASPFVLGCNAPLGPGDTPDRYAGDILAGGAGLNDRRLVNVLAHGAARAVHDLEALGVPFGRADGRLALRHLSGNSVPRSVFVPEGTGNAMIGRLSERCAETGVRMRPGITVLSLLMAGGAVVGALAAGKHGERAVAVRAGATVLALGGVGRIYEDSTYPDDVKAAAHALAAPAGATFVDMEFVQFEPAITVHPAGCERLEMPTAMLGDGAHLLNRNGERFMFRHNPGHGEKQIEKARLSLHIQDEIDAGRGFPDGSVELDTTILPPAVLENYVTHCARLRGAGLDPAREKPRVRPAAHSHMGGIAIDADGWSGIPRLFVAGEAAGGVHGASRIAGNAGADAVVFGDVAGRAAANAAAGAVSGADRAAVQDAGDMLAALLNRPRTCDPAALAASAARAMNAGAGLRRTAAGLAQAVASLKDLRDEAGRSGAGGSMECLLALLGARAVALAGLMVATAALERAESRGAHQRLDFPDRNDTAWGRHIACRLDAGGHVTTVTLPVDGGAVPL